MERKIGEIFTCNGKTYQVVKGFSCNGCVFIKDGSCYSVSEFLGPCDYANRTDKTSVIFKEIKGMEIKNNQLTINIPEGMEIDILNSNFGAGVICFKKKQSEFKDGDIVALVVRKCIHIAIFQSRQEAYIGFHAVLCQNDELLLEEPFREYAGDIELRLATDSEKKQLFLALKKKGKAWNAEKKQVVDLKIKWMSLKPFDKVITRNAYDDIWTANIFSHMDSCGEYVTIGCAGGYHYCLPYNDETAHLLGTTDEWKGGKG